MGWSDLGELENNDTYIVNLDYNFIILEEHLNGEVIHYQIVIDNMENVSYGNNITLNNGVLTYIGSEKVYLTGYKTDDSYNLEKLKIDFNTFKQDVEGLFATDDTGTVSGTNNIQLPSVVAKAPIRVGFGFNDDKKNIIVDTIGLGNNVEGDWHGIYTEEKRAETLYNVNEGIFKMVKTGSGTNTTYLSKSLPAGTYTIKSEVLSGTSSSEVIIHFLVGGTTTDLAAYTITNQNVYTFTLTEDATAFNIYTSSSNVFDNFTFRLQLERGDNFTGFAKPYIEEFNKAPQTNLRFTIDNTSMYIRGDRELVDGEEVIYSGGQYFIKLNNDYLPIESSGMAISKPNERVLVENAMQEVMLYNNGLEVSEDYKIDELEVLTIINQDETEVDLNINNATITDTKITHPDISNGDLVYFTYKYQGDFPDVEYEIIYGIEAQAQNNVQSDWEQTDNTKDDFIKNKPDIDVINQRLDNVENDIELLKEGTIVDPLDIPVVALNNLTLREVFETNNIFKFTEVSRPERQSAILEDEILKLNVTTSGTTNLIHFTEYEFKSDSSYYYAVEVEIKSGGFNQVGMYEAFQITNMTTVITESRFGNNPFVANAEGKQFRSHVFTPTNTTTSDRLITYVDSNSEVWLNIKLIPTTELGLTLTSSEMNYWLQKYNNIKLGIDNEDPNNGGENPMKQYMLDEVDRVVERTLQMKSDLTFSIATDTHTTLSEKTMYKFKIKKRNKQKRNS